MKIKRKTVTKSKYFQGEMMVCHKCGKMQRSNPNWESGWTVIELDSHAAYYCPTCFGGFSIADDQPLTPPSPTVGDDHAN